MGKDCHVQKQAGNSMIRAVLSLLAILFLWLSPACAADQADPHARDILRDLLTLKDALQKARGEPPAFLTYWDFDGTILDGDCSEGLERNGAVIYKGMAQVAIEAGFSSLYQAPAGFGQFWTDYQYLDSRVGHWLSYPFILQMLRGAKVPELEALAARQFREVFSKHYFASSVYLLRELNKAGIETHIISASAERFVRGAAATLDISADNIHGIRSRERNGSITEELVYPVTYAEGKLQRIEELLRARRAQKPQQPLHIIAGFGNSYHTDGPFLRFIAQQQLPFGKALSVMINGGTPPQEYRGLFRCVEQKR